MSSLVFCICNTVPNMLLFSMLLRTASIRITDKSSIFGQISRIAGRRALPKAIQNSNTRFLPGKTSLCCGERGSARLLCGSFRTSIRQKCRIRPASLKTCPKSKAPFVLPHSARSVPFACVVGLNWASLSSEDCGEASSSSDCAVLSGRRFFV